MRMLIALAIAGLVGCGAAGPSPASLVGLTVGDATAKIGAPDSMTASVVPVQWNDEGPGPTTLKPGDAYQTLYYHDRGGKQLHLWAVSPAVYAGVMGTHPGPEPLYIVEVHEAPAGVMY